eukprot:TRINITY_DN5131_c0_g1_i1.p1 TRINITY_DN5131_c0_g1~~TRINITY_DN5131_c0_g1_i1.p1  ORF type:complete len:1513 (+),score=341.71 TRINITY_DN5131_c0_g1_i1:582-4541(+)
MMLQSLTRDDLQSGELLLLADMMTFAYDLLAHTLRLFPMEKKAVEMALKLLLRPLCEGRAAHPLVTPTVDNIVRATLTSPMATIAFSSSSSTAATRYHTQRKRARSDTQRTGPVTFTFASAQKGMQESLFENLTALLAPGSPCRRQCAQILPLLLDSFCKSLDDQALAVAPTSIKTSAATTSAGQLFAEKAAAARNLNMAQTKMRLFHDLLVILLPLVFEDASPLQADALESLAELVACGSSCNPVTLFEIDHGCTPLLQDCATKLSSLFMEHETDSTVIVNALQSVVVSLLQFDINLVAGKLFSFFGRLWSCDAWKLSTLPLLSDALAVGSIAVFHKLRQLDVLCSGFLDTLAALPALGPFFMSPAALGSLEACFADMPQGQVPQIWDLFACTFCHLTDNRADLLSSPLAQKKLFRFVLLWSCFLESVLLMPAAAQPLYISCAKSFAQVSSVIDQLLSQTEASELQNLVSPLYSLFQACWSLVRASVRLSSISEFPPLMYDPHKLAAILQHKCVTSGSAAAQRFRQPLACLALHFLEERMASTAGVNLVPEAQRMQHTLVHFVFDCINDIRCACEEEHGQEGARRAWAQLLCATADDAALNCARLWTLLTQRLGIISTLADPSQLENIVGCIMRPCACWGANGSSVGSVSLALLNDATFYEIRPLRSVVGPAVVREVRALQLSGHPSRARVTALALLARVFMCLPRGYVPVQQQSACLKAFVDADAVLMPHIGGESREAVVGAMVALRQCITVLLQTDAVLVTEVISPATALQIVAREYGDLASASAALFRACCSCCLQLMLLRDDHDHARAASVLLSRLFDVAEAFAADGPWLDIYATTLARCLTDAESSDSFCVPDLLVEHMDRLHRLRAVSVAPRAALTPSQLEMCVSLLDCVRACRSERRDLSKAAKYPSFPLTFAHLALLHSVCCLRADPNARDAVRYIHSFCRGISLCPFSSRPSAKFVEWLFDVLLYLCAVHKGKPLEGDLSRCLASLAHASRKTDLDRMFINLLERLRSTSAAQLLTPPSETPPAEKSGKAEAGEIEVEECGTSAPAATSSATAAPPLTPALQAALSAFVIVVEFLPAARRKLLRVHATQFISALCDLCHFAPDPYPVLRCLQLVTRESRVTTTTPQFESAGAILTALLGVVSALVADRFTFRPEVIASVCGIVRTSIVQTRIGPLFAPSLADLLCGLLCAVAKPVRVTPDESLAVQKVSHLLSLCAGSSCKWWFVVHCPRIVRQYVEFLKFGRRSQQLPFITDAVWRVDLLNGVYACVGACSEPQLHRLHHQITNIASRALFTTLYQQFQRDFKFQGRT